MSTTINTGWLKDNNGEKFAPKTLASQVITSDGKLFEEEIKSQLENIDVGIEITKSEYEKLGESVLTDGITYFITDAGNEGSSAKDVVFDNKASGLKAVNVQDAIDELKINGSGSGSVDLTEAEYKELEASGEVDSDITYYITDGIYEENNSSGSSSDDTNIDYSQIAFDTSEIVVTPSDKILSHVGMIIHSSVLDTMEKVIAVYGGTTWVKIEGKFLLGQSDAYAIGSEGGESTHTLTVDEIPSHKHDVVARITKGHGGAAANSSISTLAEWWLDSSPSIGETTLIGGSQAHNNMPPYKTVYIWERTA